MLQKILDWRNNRRKDELAKLDAKLAQVKGELTLVQSENAELERLSGLIDRAAALRKAVRMMGFDCDKLADYVAQDGDYQCKAMLLGCVTLDAALLQERGASNIDVWREMFSGLRVNPGEGKDGTSQQGN